ncbi:MAG: DPP IV N-terminal domain-containing protein [Verrucomicrobiota bacterium]
MLLLPLVEGMGQVRVSVTVGDKTAIDLSGLKFSSSAGASAFQRTLRNDLVRSGWFTIGTTGRGSVRLVGSVTESGGQLDVKCNAMAVASGRSFMNQGYRHSAREPSRLAHRVADDIVKAVTGREGIASSKILMLGTATRSKELYICDYDGQNLIQLTKDKTVNIRPRWTPDGKSVVYTSYLRRFPDIYMIELATGKRKVLAKYPGLNVGGAVSPDGKELALVLSKDGNPELYIKNMRTGRLTRITRTSGAEASPSWSPDGKQICYVSDQAGKPNLYIVSRSGGRPTRVPARGIENVAPDWGGNGKIAYAGRFGGRFQIFVYDPATKQNIQVSVGAGDFEDPSWAPNGRHITCSREQNFRSEVYILDTMGDPPIRLLNHKGDWYSPAWSPE